MRLLAALVVPHPLAVAGTPRRWHYDRERHVFRTSWRVDRADGHGRLHRGSRTTLAVPRLAFPHGYVVRVRGGHVVSRPGARVLVVAQGRGTDRVRLLVQRR